MNRGRNPFLKLPVCKESSVHDTLINVDYITDIHIHDEISCTIFLHNGSEFLVELSFKEMQLLINNAYGHELTAVTYHD